MARKHSLLLFQGIFGGIGLVLLVVAAYIYHVRSDFIEHALRAEGKVVSFEKRAASNSSTTSRNRYVYAPVVTFYTKDGMRVTFTESTAGSGSGLNKGDSVTVYYNRSNPEEAKIATFFHLWGGFVVVLGIGVVFFVIGGTLVLVELLPFLKKRSLLRHGKKIRGEIVSIEMDTSVTVSGKHPYRILASCRHPNSVEKQILTSQRVWDDLTHDIVHKTVDIYVDRKNIHRNFFDPASIR